MIEEAPFVYEACPDIENIRKKVNKRLDDYNEKYASKKMNLVIFDDALRLTRNQRRKHKQGTITHLLLQMPRKNKNKHENKNQFRFKIK